MTHDDDRDTIARAAAALDDPGVTREGAPRAVDPLREALQACVAFADGIAPQHSLIDREALVEAIEGSLYSYSDDRGWEPTGTARSIADALLAAGLRLPGPQPDETLAWAVVGEDGALVETSINQSRAEVEGELKWGGKDIVRVAIRIVEDEA